MIEARVSRARNPAIPLVMSNFHLDAGGILRDMIYIYQASGSPGPRESLGFSSLLSFAFLLAVQALSRGFLLLAQFFSLASENRQSLSLASGPHSTLFPYLYYLRASSKCLLQSISSF